MSTDRPATTDPVDPLCRAGQCGHERHALPDPLQPPRPMTDEEAAEFERRWSATVAPRASEPNRKCPLGLRHVNCSCAEPEQPWDEAGCSRSCRNGHTRRWGACAYGKEPAPTLHRFETGVAADGYVSGGHEPMTAEQVAEWLRVQGYAVAPRASEAPRGDGSPTPNAGAAQGREGGSAAESEPRGTVKRRILEALDRWHEVGADTTGEFAGVMEAVDDYAAAIRAAERELVAAQIEAVFVLARRDQSPAEAKADAYRTAAAIARGDQ